MEDKVLEWVEYTGVNAGVTTLKERLVREISLSIFINDRLFTTAMIMPTMGLWRFMLTSQCRPSAVTKSVFSIQCSGLAFAHLKLRGIMYAFGFNLWLRYLDQV